MSQVFNLAHLLDPVHPEAFKQQYWEKQPLIVARQNPDYYRDLLTLVDVDQILSNSRIRSSDIRLLRVGQDIPLRTLMANGLNGQVGMLEGFYKEYRDGATIVLQFLHERWQPLKRLCQALAAEFSAAFQVNVYLTPPSEKGLLTHYDLHDVFVLQVEGSKHWRLYQNPVTLPLRSQPYLRTMDPGEPIEEFDLHSGDLLYVPRGYVHDAAAVDSTSLHLTVGVHPVTWASVLLGAVGAVIEQDARFRESLPIGFTREEAQRELAEARLVELLDVLREQIKPVSVISDAIELALQGRQPFLDGHLLDLEAISGLKLETRVRRRPEILWSLSIEGEEVCLSYQGKKIRMPSYMEPYLQYIAETEDCSAAELSDELDDTGKLVLIRSLLKEGFLTTLHPSGLTR